MQKGTEERTMMAATDMSRVPPWLRRVEDVEPTRVEELLRLREEDRARDRDLIQRLEEMVEQQRRMLAACRSALGDASYARAVAPVR
jgi:hypothetical protein